MEPLTPSECDLRGMEWMPLFGHRLFNSDFDARATDAEFRCALKLWWAAWQQVPAASLPDEDRVLCHLSGLGRDIKTWLKVKAGALYGFVKCSDGRLYHKALAAEANEAWDRRVKERARKAKWRDRKNDPDDGDNGPDGTVPETGTERGRDSPVPPHVPADKTRQDRTGPKREDSASLRSAAPAEPSPDVRTELFRSGLGDLRAMTGLGDRQSRTLIGALLRDQRDNAAAVLGAIQRARDLRPADPVGWLKAACKPRRTIGEALMAGEEPAWDDNPVMEFIRDSQPQGQRRDGLAQIARDADGAEPEGGRHGGASRELRPLAH